MSDENYISCKKQLLKSFDKSIARSKRVLIDRYGKERANSLIRESRREYEALIPQIPFIGHRSPFLIFLTSLTGFSELSTPLLLKAEEQQILQAGPRWSLKSAVLQPQYR